MHKSESQTYLSNRPYFDPKRLLDESDFGTFESSNYSKSKLIRENANDPQRTRKTTQVSEKRITRRQ